MRTKFIYIENGRLSLTKEEFERYLEDAYQEGLRDGRSYTYGSVQSVNDNYGSSICYDEGKGSLSWTGKIATYDNTVNSIYATNTVDTSLTEATCLKGEN